jgi:uncharacterized OsmC-like protein
MFESSNLKVLQAPIKERYRREPSTALSTLRAHGTMAEDFAFRGQAGKARVEAGLHPGAGGSGRHACPAEIFLAGLASCAGVTLCAISANMGLGMRAVGVTAEGDLDMRGTMGVSEAAPVGFQRIRVLFELDTDVPDGQLDTLLRLTDSFCVVSRSLSVPVQMSFSRARAAAAG